MKRRDAIALIAISPAAPAAAQHAHHGAGTKPPAAEGLQFFTAAERELADAVAEVILPADEHSGGAREAKVADFIDQVVAQAGGEEQEIWRNGLAALDAEARNQFGKAFAKGSLAECDALIARLAEAEDDPKTPLERFFVVIKEHTVSGYYTSRVGLMNELEYKGVYPIAAFEPCSHKEHGA